MRCHTSWLLEPPFLRAPGAFVATARLPEAEEMDVDFDRTVALLPVIRLGSTRPVGQKSLSSPGPIDRALKHSRSHDGWARGVLSSHS